ncbi:tetratricopeptide repeat protein [Carboxylicivirga sp. RSCT41]|uniref:tetratricopeptide repeat protein n=1 Tax=Carboxylicivirga agarovorans TaxID=3417570 RepID=UPI003D343333
MVKTYLILISLGLFLCFNDLYSQNKFIEDSLRLEVDNAEQGEDEIRNMLVLAGYVRKTDVLEGINILQDALEIAREINHAFLITDINNKLGALHVSIGNYELGGRYYFDALNTAEEKGYKKFVFYSFNNLGTLNLKFDDLDDGLEYFFKALNVFKEMDEEEAENERRHLSGTYNNIGLIYNEKEDFKSAISYFHRGIDNYKDYPAEDFIIPLYNNLADAYRSLNELDSARYYSDVSYRLALKMEDSRLIAVAATHKANFHLFAREYEEAYKYSMLAYDHGDKIHSMNHKLEATEVLYQSAKQLKRYEESVAFLEENRALQDSLFNMKNIAELAKMQLKYDYSKLEEQKELEAKKQRLYISLLVALLLVGLIIALLILNLTRLRSKKTRLEKEKLEDDLLNKNKELATNVMYLVKKNEVLNSITNSLQELKTDLPAKASQKIQSVIFDVQGITDQDVWEDFELRFQQVHEQFYENLRLAHPDLTPNEIRLSAFLSLNMTTKEISAITKQNVRSVEAARTRLRKKLDLTNTDVNLITYLSSL